MMTGEQRLIVAILREAINEAMKGDLRALAWVNGSVFEEYVELVSGHEQAQTIIKKARERVNVNNKANTRSSQEVYNRHK
jgi:hypothetical protein